MSRRWLETITKKQEFSTAGYIKADKRSKHQNRINKSSRTVENSVREHIAMFNRVESHYCKKDSSREYLDEKLNLSKMYTMYKEWMINKHHDSIASESRYRFIFNTEYNLFFHKLKKGQCDDCAAYQILPDKEKLEFKDAHDIHIKNKNFARELMVSEKENAKNNQAICTASFDLQKVLMTPRSEVSVMYYKRKLSIYNFTIYNLATNTYGKKQT